MLGWEKRIRRNGCGRGSAELAGLAADHNGTTAPDCLDAVGVTPTLLNYAVVKQPARGIRHEQVGRHVQTGSEPANHVQRIGLTRLRISATRARDPM